MRRSSATIPKRIWEASTAALVTQQRQLAYYHLTAPFDGIVGDIPVHLGDYVSQQTLLTTVDENADLEAYIYIPTEKAASIRMGLPVQIVTSSGELIESTKIDFVSQQVDNGIQGILVKAPVHAPLDRFRNAQLVKARVVWSTAPDPDGSGAGGHAHRRAIICLRRGPGGRRHRCQAARGHARRYDRERLCGHRRLEAWGQSHHLRHSVPYRRRADTADQLANAVVQTKTAGVCCGGLKGSAGLVDFFIKRPIFATVCALLIILAGAVCIPDSADLAVSQSGAAAGDRHQQLRGRECAGGGVRGHHSAGAADQRRRGYALHHLDQFE